MSGAHCCRDDDDPLFWPDQAKDRIADLAALVKEANRLFDKGHFSNAVIAWQGRADAILEQQP